MSMQLQSKVLIVVLEKIEPLTVIKNEPPESEIVEIGIDDILDSSDEESIPNIKDIEIVLPKLSEDLIKSETDSGNIFENNHVKSVETQFGINDILDSSDKESIPDIKDIEIVLHKLSEDLIKSETVSEYILENNHLESVETQIGMDDILDSSDKESNPDIKEIEIVLHELSEDLIKSETDSGNVLENNHLESVETQVGIDDILDSSDKESIPDIKDIEIVLHKLSEDLIKSKTDSGNILENNHLESVETQVDIDDILDSSDEESIPDIKEIEIVLHELSEDLIKSKIDSENILETNHTESVETQVFVQTENNKFVEIENITQSENLNETENTSDGNVNRGTGQELIEVQSNVIGSNEHFNAFGNQTDKQLAPSFSKNLSDIGLRSRKAKRSGNTDSSECDKPVKTTSYEKLEKDKKKRKVIEVPIVLVGSHESTTLAKAKHSCNKNKSTHKQNKKRYCCEKCTYTSGKSSHFKLHQLTHKTKTEIDDRLLKYRCNKCKYKTYVCSNLKKHKLTHLKPEEIQYFYCYHCPYKYKVKDSLKNHVINHFKKKEVQFDCYICDFTTLKRNLIIEHFKTHPKHHSKCDETDYKNQFLTYTKYRCDKCKYKSCWLRSFKEHKLMHLKPGEIPYFYCYHCSFNCKGKNDLRKHIFRHFKNEDVPFHCYICDFTTRKRNLIIEHFKKHPKHHSKCDKIDFKNQLETYAKKQMRYCCEKCTYTTGHFSSFKLHQLTHKTKAEIDDRLLKYRCDKCKYKTYISSSLKRHKLQHLKPEEIPYFYCYHCPHKSKRKSNLQSHIFNHFKNEDVSFHCYICDFTTLKRNLIIEHFKHPKHHSKCDETD